MHLQRMWGQLCLVCFTLAVVPAAHGEWATQEITLQPGWNAVYLAVHPSPSECAEIFQEIPIKSVWTWNKRFTSAQYVRDPSTLVPAEEEWLVYFPSSAYNAFLTTFQALIGGKGYLIELQGSEPVHLVLQGEAVTEKTAWLSDSYNMTGFHVDPAHQPTFAAFFAPSKELSGQPAYRLGSDGRWRLIEDVENELVRAGEAYLIYCKGASAYSGPLSIETDFPGGLKYGMDIDELTLTLKNETPAAKKVTLTLEPSARKDAQSKSPVAGGVPLYYKPLLAWLPMDKPVEMTLQPDSKGQLKLAVHRAGMPPPPSPDAVFESVLKITDEAGSLLSVPVSASKAINDAGLYVGLVVVNAVSEAGGLDNVTPKPTASEFRFRLIVHKDDRTPPKVKLLQHVTVMQVQPYKVPDPENPDEEIVVPARYVLLSDDSLIPNYEGVSLRDGDIVGRRISTPIFGFDVPVELAQNASDANVYTGQIAMAYDDPKNPFLHRYHPDHNNLNEYYEAFVNAGGADVSDGVESYSFTRSLTLTFTENDPDRLGELAWGYDLIGGVYEETITGLHKRALHIKGTFRLNRVSSVPRLNDEL